MSRDEHEPIHGAGLRHAVALTAVFLVAFAYPIAATAAGAIDGFSILLGVTVTVVMGVTGAVVAVAWPLPSTPVLFTRGFLLLALATAVRSTVPSPATAWAQVRAGEAPIFSGALYVALFLIGVAYVLGHVVTTGVAMLATPAPTVQVGRKHEQRALVAWWSSLVVLAIVAGSMADAAGITGSVLAVGAALTTLLLLSDLRARTAPPAGARPPIVTAPLALRSGAAAFAVVVTAAGAALLAPLFPVDALRQPPQVPDLFGWLSDTQGDIGELIPQDPLFGAGPDDAPGDATDDGEEGWGLPSIPWQVPAAIAALALAIALRPHRWRGGVRWLLQLLRRAQPADERTLGDLDAFGELDDAEADDAPAGRLRRMLRRFRPRPRDPRSAVLDDYFHVERLLTRSEQGRERYETPREHALRVHVSDAHAQLADLAADARFARTPPDRDTVDRARELRRDIEQGLRG